MENDWFSSLLQAQTTKRNDEEFPKTIFGRGVKGLHKNVYETMDSLHYLTAHL